MTTINLKDFYYWYLTDELVEVPDEVAEELMASKRREGSPCGNGCATTRLRNSCITCVEWAILLSDK